LEACRGTVSGKCWHHLRRRNELFGSAVALLLVAAWSGETAQADPTSDDTLASEAPVLDAFLREVSTLRAQFHQELWSADKLIENAEGEVALKRPNRFLWKYRAPIEQLIVADGTRLWMYDVELAQVTVAPLDAPTASSPAMLLSGDQAVRERFRVVETFVLDELSWVRLEPKLPDTDFRSILLAFKDATPVRLEMVDGLNQTTRIDFSQVEINPELADAVFDFSPPDGVDVLGEP
jgi:outer membrane lipoprotein carrier protein